MASAVAPWKFCMTRSTTVLADPKPGAAVVSRAANTCTCGQLKLPGSSDGIVAAAAVPNNLADAAASPRLLEGFISGVFFSGPEMEDRSRREGRRDWINCRGCLVALVVV